MKDSNKLSASRPAAKLIDNHGRILDYLRISVTDRCNLRCSYCMPPEGVPHIPHENILSFEEIIRLSKIFVGLGVNKIRFTGGEPFVRKGFADFLLKFRESISDASLHLTTNGVVTHKHLDSLINAKVNGINLSLDTLVKEKFEKLTFRNTFDEVIKSLDLLIESKIPLKINTVVMQDFNIDEIIDIANIARDNDVEIRFIEQMEFNGNDLDYDVCDAVNIFNILMDRFGSLTPVDKASSTASCYQIPGFKGTVGIIAGHSRTFCDTCSRMRITSIGMLKTCLYDNGVLSLRDLIRSGAGDGEIINSINTAVSNRFKDGFEAEAFNLDRKKSMASIGG
jgi:molybdenum cofactor biosynthesis protein A